MTENSAHGSGFRLNVQSTLKTKTNKKPQYIPWKSLNAFSFISRLLVGAPRAEALPLQRANRTGGLYSCDITSRGPCTRIEFDNDGVCVFCSYLFIWSACLYHTLLAVSHRDRNHKHLILQKGPLLIVSVLTVLLVLKILFF